MEASLGGPCAHCRFESQLRNSKLRKSQSFLKACKKPPNLCSWRRCLLIKLDGKPTFPLLQRELVHLFSKVVHIRNLCKVVWNNVPQCLYSKHVQKYAGCGSGSLLVTVRLSAGLHSSDGSKGWSICFSAHAGRGWQFSVPHCCSLEASVLCHMGLFPGLTAHSKGLAERVRKTAPKTEATVFITRALGNWQ